MRKPGVQNPHCRAWHSRKASWTGCSTWPPRPSSRARPSTVSTAAPSTWTASTRQERTGAPSTTTVQAPQTPCSQPTCVPVRRRSWRSASDSNRRTGTVASRGTPFTVTVIVRSVSTETVMRRSSRCSWLGAGLASLLGRRRALRCSLARHPRGGLRSGVGERAFGQDADQQAAVVRAGVQVAVRVDQGAGQRAGGGPVGLLDRGAGNGLGEVVHLGDQADGDVGGTHGGHPTRLVERDDDAGAADRVVALAAGGPGGGGGPEPRAGRGENGRGDRPAG